MVGSEISHRFRSLFQKTESVSHRVEQISLLVAELGQLKGAAMKFGQFLALEGRDFLPDEAIQILEKLQNQASFMDLPVIRGILEKELGREISQLERFSEQPIAAASIGQVHTAWVDGKKVAIKIQYPGIRETLESDLKIFKRVANTGLFFLGKREILLDSLLEELRELFTQETHYLIEADFTQRFAELTSHLEWIQVPQVNLALTTDQVLTLSYENGHTLSKCLRGGLLSKELKTYYSQKILGLYIKEFCDWGLVQTDPNLGNFLLRPEKRELVLLDFGATKEFTLKFRVLYSQLVLSVLSGKDTRAMELAIEMDLIDSQESGSARTCLLKLLKESMSPFAKTHFDFSDSDYTKLMRNHSLALGKELKYSPPPRNLIFLHRKLGGVFQMIRQMGVTLDLRPYVGPFEELSVRHSVYPQTD